MNTCIIDDISDQMYLAQGAIGQIIIICGLQGERRNTKNIPRGRRLSNLSRPRAR